MREMFKKKNEVLRLKPRNKISGCYDNLTVMWLTKKYYQSKKKWVTSMQVKDYTESL